MSYKARTMNILSLGFRVMNHERLESGNALSMQVLDDKSLLVELFIR